MADDTVIKNVAARIDDIPRFSRVIFIYFNEPIIVMKFIESTRREIVRVCHSRHPSPSTSIGSSSLSWRESRGNHKRCGNDPIRGVSRLHYCNCNCTRPFRRLVRLAVAPLVTTVGAFSEEGWMATPSGTLDGGPPLSFSFPFSLLHPITRKDGSVFCSWNNSILAIIHRSPPPFLPPFPFSTPIFFPKNLSSTCRSPFPCPYFRRRAKTIIA